MIGIVHDWLSPRVRFVIGARGDVIDAGLPGEVERLNDRGKLEKRTFSIANAQKAEQYDTVVGSMTIVSITR